VLELQIFILWSKQQRSFTIISSEYIFGKSCANMYTLLACGRKWAVCPGFPQDQEMLHYSHNFFLVHHPHSMINRLTLDIFSLGCSDHRFYDEGSFPLLLFLGSYLFWQQCRSFIIQTLIKCKKKMQAFSEKRMSKQQKKNPYVNGFQLKSAYLWSQQPNNEKRS
jgi:hypothetical protein